MPAQDEDELFDLYDRDGRPLDRSKPRALVHRDGDWHRSLHLWVWTRLAGRPHVVFQERSAAKHTWPGALDAAVTGHLRAGESVADALREADEEIGLRVGIDDVVHIGSRRRSDAHRPGVIDNELQEVFAVARPVDFDTLRPHPLELAAVLALPIDDALAVLRGECDGAAVRRDGVARVALVDFVPGPDGYWATACASLSAIVAGAPIAPWRLG